MKKAMMVVVCAGMASVASADVLSASAYGPSLEREGASRAAGSLVHTGNGAFSSVGGAILNELDGHTIGLSESMTNALGRPSTVTSSVTTVGDLRTVTINWTTDGGMIRPGDSVGGAFITDLSFELGSANFPNGGIADSQFLGFDHAPSGANPGSFEADFDLLDANGAVLFSGAWFVDVTGAGEIAGRTFISAGGADLAQFNIGGGTASVSYFIPTPGSLALLGLAGLAGARRRR